MNRSTKPDQRSSSTDQIAKEYDDIVFATESSFRTEFEQGDWSIFI